MNRGQYQDLGPTHSQSIGRSYVILLSNLYIDENARAHIVNYIGMVGGRTGLVNLD